MEAKRIVDWQAAMDEIEARHRMKFEHARIVEEDDRIPDDEYDESIATLAVE
jgi:hypothetical protein